MQERRAINRNQALGRDGMAEEREELFTFGGTGCLSGASL